MKRRIVWINLGLVLVLVAAGVGAYLWLFAPKTEVATSGRTVSVQTGDVTQTVTATGSVETAGIVELSFATGGEVTSVTVEQGDTVRANRRLASLDGSSAQAAVTNAQASYVQAVNGAKAGSLTLAAATKAVTDAERTARLNADAYARDVADAKADLAEASSSWSATCLDPALACPDTEAWAQLRSAEADVASAKTAYEQAVENATASETTQDINVKQAAANVTSAESKASTDCSTYGTASSQCVSAQTSLTSAQHQYESTVNAQKVSAIQSQQSLVNADAKITAANVNLKKLQSSLTEASADGVTAATKALQTAQRAQETGVAADRTTVRKAKESLASLRAADAAVTTSAGTITADEAAIEVAQASLDEAERDLDSTVLRAPVAGTVASVAIDPGDTTTAGATVMTVIPKAAYQIVASFSEADALKVAVGQKATVTFDALSEDTAEGTVTEVGILPTSTDSTVTTYSATITLDSAPEGVREGMSASVVVTVDEVSDVLWVPSAAVTTSGGQSTVTVRTDGVDSTVTVETGLEGDSGIEITSGLEADQQVVIDTSTSESDSFAGFPGGGLGFTGGGGAPPAGGAPPGGGQ
jgi:RND family efflux transporter MFP subunit